MTGASDGVAVSLGVHFEPLEHQELRQLKRHAGGLRGQVFGDQYLGAMIAQVPVQLQVVFAGVGVDRYLGMAASTDGG